MTDATTLDEDAFSRDDKPRDYTATIKVSGTISVSIKADSLEDAQRQAETELEKIENEGFVQLDDVDEIEVARVRKDRPMYRVLREGHTMQVTHLDPGDIPRAPDERGF